MRPKVIAAAVCAALTIAAATAWTSAQAVAITKVQPFEISGSDLGFRVEGLRGSTPIGTLVVKVKGVWVEAEIARPNAISLSTR